jgi:signal peptidase S26 family
MNPTLKAGDGLIVKPYGGREIQAGDVIVFRNPENRMIIAHRVISVDPMGVKTIGDNNNKIDPNLLGKHDILGRVTSVRRRNRSVKINGGVIGVIRGRYHRIRRRLHLMASRLLHPIYHKIADSGILLKLQRFFPKTHILEFHKNSGLELHFLMGNRVIGRRLPGMGCWQIAPPFRLFFDEASFPK